MSAAKSKLGASAVVTGAAAGLGRAFTRELAARGLKVLAIDIDPKGLAELKDLCPPGSVETQPADVRDYDALAAAADRARALFGGVDVWVNNAGVAGGGRADELDPAMIERVIAVDLLGVLYGTRAALGVMRAPERGLIVNVASVAGLVPAPFITPYVAAKHGVVGFTRGLREELKQRHSPIRAVLVCPGFARTAILGQIQGLELPAWMERLASDPEAVARETFDAVEKGRDEILPTLNGRLMARIHRASPGAALKMSRLATARGWRELLGLDPVSRGNGDST
ncbi:MAG: SDR family oxidoreductase [Bdellovibrionales bacterium]|nr:SDR family oxidoreductase [Bdellovibrionales bacterium]